MADECCQGTSSPTGKLCGNCPHTPPRPSSDILDPADIAARMKKAGTFDKDEPWPGWNAGKKLVEKEPEAAPDDDLPDEVKYIDPMASWLATVDFSQIETYVLGTLGVNADEWAKLDEDGKRKLAKEKWGEGFAVGGPVTGRWSGGRMGEVVFPRTVDMMYVSPPCQSHARHLRPSTYPMQKEVTINVTAAQIGKHAQALDEIINRTILKKMMHRTFIVEGLKPKRDLLLANFGHAELEDIVSFSLWTQFGYSMPPANRKYDVLFCDDDHKTVYASWTETFPLIQDEVRVVAKSIVIPCEGKPSMKVEPA